jgi:hypothetical protein
MVQTRYGSRNIFSGTIQIVIFWIHSFAITKVSTGIHRAELADFILDLRNCYSQSRLYIGFTHKDRVVKSVLFIFGGKLGSVLLV